MSAQNRESRNRPWVVIFILLSLLAHLLFVLAIVVISHFLPPPKLKPLSQDLTTVSLSLQQPPPVPSTPPPMKRPFMPTTPDAQAPHKNTLIESDNDTRLRSRSQEARDADSMMPDVLVKQSQAASLRDAPNAPSKAKPNPAASATQKEEEQKTAQQSPQPAQQTVPHPNQAQRTTPQPRTDAQQTETNPSPVPQPKTAQQQLDANGLPVLPRLNAPTMAPASARRVQAAPNSSIQQVAQNVHGAVGTHGDDSPEAMATELGRYKAKVYRTVGALWYRKVEDQLQVLPVGIVHIQFTISKDGSVETKVLEGDSGALQMLQAISLNSIREAAPFDPFTDSMIQEVGDSYTDDFTFSIYGGGE